MQVSRRDFLRVTAGAGAGTAIGGLVGLRDARACSRRGAGAPHPRCEVDPQYLPILLRRLCDARAGQSDRIVNIEGDPRSPTTKARCAPRRRDLSTPRQSQRQTKVLHRKPGASSWEVVEARVGDGPRGELTKKTRDDTFIEKLAQRQVVNMSPAIFASAVRRSTRVQPCVPEVSGAGSGVVAIENQARIMTQL